MHKTIIQIWDIIMNRILAYNPVANSMDEGMGAIKQQNQNLNQEMVIMILNIV